ncbi:MAG: type II toxin-antitoxin system HicA family toxin [Chloroflexota bacterium]
MTNKQPKTGKDFIQLARKSDKVSKIRAGKGSHVVVEFEDGTSVSVPAHGNKQLSKGILHAIMQAFKAAGVIGLILLSLWLFFPQLVGF